MKVFISHKQEDSLTATLIAQALGKLHVSYYLDVLDSRVINSGKELTDHIKEKLNNCTDIIVVMSESTLYSQWVPFEVGMAAQLNMPTATYLQSTVKLPEFLEYWPRLKYQSDITTYVSVRRRVEQQNRMLYHTYETAESRKHREVNVFYNELKRELR